MKVALVTHTPAFPATAGNRSKILQLARAIIKLGHDLTFILLPRSGTVDDAAHETAFGKSNYYRIEHHKTLTGRIRKRLVRSYKKGLRSLGVEAGYYSSLDQEYNDEWTRLLADIAKGIDVAMVEYVVNSRAFDAFPSRTLRLLDTHNSFADRHKSYVSRGLVSGYWYSLRPRDENRGFRRADAILAIQHQEADRFCDQLLHDRNGRDPDVAVVSHILNLDNRITDYRAGYSALFLASDNPANRHAVEYFIKQILPNIVRQIPTFDFKLVGPICQAVPDTSNVTKMGYVDDLLDAFAQTPLAVNPLLLGSEISIKVLDAMAAAVPTISTETGLRGLHPDYRGGVICVPNSDHKAFATEVVRFAKDPVLRQKVGLEGFQVAKQWNATQIAELARCLELRRGV